MVKCIETHTLTLSAAHCRNYQELLNNVSQAVKRDACSLQIYFLHGKEATLIESDADVLGMKYVAKKQPLNFKVQVKKSKQQYEEEGLQAALDDYLNQTYTSIAKQTVEKEVKETTESYLKELYSEIARSQAEMKMIEEQQARSYVAKMTSSLVFSHHHIPNIPARPRTSRIVRVSPDSREKSVERMVSRVLSSMMPLMVHQISSRIMEELSCSKTSRSFFEREQNPEEY